MHDLCRCIAHVAWIAKHAIVSGSIKTKFAFFEPQRIVVKCIKIVSENYNLISGSDQKSEWGIFFWYTLIYNCHTNIDNTLNLLNMLNHCCLWFYLNFIVSGAIEIHPSAASNDLKHYNPKAKLTKKKSVSILTHSSWNGFIRPSSHESAHMQLNCLLSSCSWNTV